MQNDVFQIINLHIIKLEQIIIKIYLGQMSRYGRI